MRMDITLSAQVRETRGKNEARRLRAAGMVPAVLYGAYQDAVAVSINPKEVNRILRSKTGHNTLFNLDVDGREKSLAMIVDWLFDPVKENLLHVDLKRIDPTKKIRVSVPVFSEGEPKGVKQQGGLLELVTREVEIEVLPDEIPEGFVVNVSELLIGQAKRASDLQLTGSMKLVSAEDSVLAHCVALRAVVEETPAVVTEAVAAPAEPEVAKRGKKEEDKEEEKEKKK